MRASDPYIFELLKSVVEGQEIKELLTSWLTIYIVYIVYIVNYLGGVTSEKSVLQGKLYA